MYKILAVIVGSITSFMILSNGLLTDSLGNTPALIFIHITGLLGSIVLFTLKKEHWQSLKNLPVLYLFGGSVGTVMVYLTNLSFLAIGVTITLVLSLVGRIIASTVIDHFGLLGMEKYPFVKQKIIGLLCITLGVVCIVLF